MAESIEVIKAVNELINAQADQLWEISISLIAAEVFMIAHLLLLKKLGINRCIVSGVLGLSVLCHALSIAFGYLSKGALINAMILLADGKEWKFPDQAALFNSLQVFTVTLAIIIFVVCFFYYSSILAQAMVKE
jgi:hypothetical protein